MRIEKEKETSERRKDKLIATTWEISRYKR